jgi:hypothetical protein
MEDNASCRKINFLQPESSRKKGRPWKCMRGGRKHAIEICGVKSSTRPRHTRGCSAEEEEEEEGGGE